MAIIAISGKKGSGKDTVGKIIQGLIIGEDTFENGILGFLDTYDDYLGYPDKEWDIKKFADPLKDMLCIMINCTREDLEDEEFKSKELPEEWWYYKLKTGIYGQFELVNYSSGKYSGPGLDSLIAKRYLVKPTPRLLLQLLGTECGRNILHPNLWINSLFSQYEGESDCCGDGRFCPDGDGELDGNCVKDLKYPNWIITDLRFPNELKAVDDRGGLTIRVNRKCKTCNNIIKSEKNHGIGCCEATEGILHESETALDNTKLDYVINNDGDIPELIEKVREILIKQGII